MQTQTAKKPRIPNWNWWAFSVAYATIVEMSLIILMGGLGETMLNSIFILGVSLVVFLKMYSLNTTDDHGRSHAS